MSGSGTLARWLREQRLLDELQVLVHPPVVGKGKKLFESGVQVPLRLRLLSSEALAAASTWLSIIADAAVAGHSVTTAMLTSEESVQIVARPRPTWYLLPVRQPLCILVALVSSLTLVACVPATGPESTTAAPSASNPASAGSSSSAEPASYREITFAARDAGRRSGRLFGTGRVAIVLSHMGSSGASQDDWTSFAAELAKHGHQALTYARAADADLNDFADHWRDVLGAATFLRDNGAEVVIAVGASIGAMASLYAAEQPTNGINAVIWLAGVQQAESYEFTEVDVSSVRCPILFISGEADAYGGAKSARQLHAWAPAGELLIIDSGRHGTDILAEDGPNAGTLRRTMLEFVERAAGQKATC
ncbi:dihydrofolate reductase family protein [Qaidamihabitans albus]|uniref:dihydrofolate reductase family protein n=1 Tax=Qaidamihabitans albus TaxID=2795733 RepID=UPI0018F21456|nr:dihydrofolate reductase family protein [Qaidamihabitans albus]